MEQENQEQGAQYKEKVKFDAPAQTLEQSLNSLVKYGGFDFLESTIDGVANMNPERKARKKIFLSEAD
ncbi:MAG: type VI secretion system contractile sheath protein TssC, partial [Bacteroidetes bacterium]|nr:type VI secretion system contractile sheath protein TssC [Bacteroidota bacterium]